MAAVDFKHEVAELARVEARSLIADVRNPLSWLWHSLTGLKQGFEDGSMSEMFTAVFSHGATKMLEDVKRRCPVDDGDLRESLYVTTEDVTETGPRGRVKRLSVENTFACITTDSPYAYFVEYGTVDTPAQPFMRPAADQGAGAFVLLVGDIITGNIILAFWGRLAMDLFDVGLKHAAPGKQKGSLAGDLAWTVAGAAAGKLAGKVAGKVGGKLLGKNSKLAKATKKGKSPKASKRTPTRRKRKP